MVKKTFLLAFFLCAFILAGPTRAHAAAELSAHRRCAFDIGSGETKLAMAEVTLAGSTPRVIKLLSRKALIPFAASLQDSVIPDAVIEEGVRTLNELRNACEILDAREYSGVATSGFRMARNASPALARLSQETRIPLRVISGEEEAALAFLAAAAALRSNGSDLVVWDIGGGSLQFSMRAFNSPVGPARYVVSSGHQGAETFRRVVAQQFQRGSAHGVNPLSQAEMTRAIQRARDASRDVNAEIVQHLRRGSTRVVGVGGIHTESLVNQAGLRTSQNRRSYHLDAVRTAARRAVGMTDEDFRHAFPENKYPASQATNLALVLGYMEGLQIKEVIPIDVNLADGLLVDSSHWSRESLR
jgi:exopolyphosphatase / guanosine-5'-triphosphate,3'-diphosphate pyrophosphatase